MSRAPPLTNHCALFMSALHYMEYVATLCSFFKRIRSTNLASQKLGEVEEQLVTLSYCKYGHLSVEVFLEHGQSDVQEQVVISLSSQVEELSCHPSGHTVIVKCIKISSDSS